MPSAFDRIESKNPPRFKFLLRQYSDQVSQKHAGNDDSTFESVRHFSVWPSPAPSQLQHAVDLLL